MTRLSTAIKCSRRAEAEAEVEADTEAAAGANPVSSQRNLCPGTDMPCHSSTSLPRCPLLLLPVSASRAKKSEAKKGACDCCSLPTSDSAIYHYSHVCVRVSVCIAYTAAYKVEVVNQNLNLTHAATANGSSLALHRHKKKGRIHPLLCLPFVCLIFVRDCPASVPLPHSPLPSATA